MSDSYQIAMLGAGFIGRFYAESLHSHRRRDRITVAYSRTEESVTEFADEYDVERTVLVDDVDGTAHGKYGEMPNSVHVVNPDGVVVMRGDWNDVRTVKRVLANRDPNRLVEREIYRGRPLFFTPKKGILRVLLDAGPRALWDFLRHAPSLALMHLKKEFRGETLE